MAFQVNPLNPAIGGGTTATASYGRSAGGAPKFGQNQGFMQGIEALSAKELKPQHGNSAGVSECSTGNRLDYSA